MKLTPIFFFHNSAQDLYEELIRYHKKPKDLTNKKLLTQILDSLAIPINASKLTPIIPSRDKDLADSQHLDHVASQSYLKRQHSREQSGFDSRPEVKPGSLGLFPILIEKELSKAKSIAHESKIHPSGSTLTLENSSKIIYYDDPEDLDNEQHDLINAESLIFDHSVDQSTRSNAHELVEPADLLASIELNRAETFDEEQQQQQSVLDAEQHISRRLLFPDCSIKNLFYEAKNLDRETGDWCSSEIEIRVCSGSCINIEQGHRGSLPLITRTHTSCNFIGASHRRITLNNCSSEFVDDDLRHYDIIEPSSCECKPCDVVDTECLTT